MYRLKLSKLKLFFETRPYILALAIAVVISIAVWLISGQSGVFEVLENQVIDQFVRWRGFEARSAQERIALCSIDDYQSQKEYGPWPWPRDTLDQLVERLASAEAKVIVIAQPCPMSEDSLVAEASVSDIEGYCDDERGCSERLVPDDSKSKVVLGVSFGDPQSSIQSVECDRRLLLHSEVLRMSREEFYSVDVRWGLNPNDRRLACGADYQAAADIFSDASVVRDMQLLIFSCVLGADDDDCPTYPALGLRAAQLAGFPESSIVLSEGVSVPRLKIGDSRVPIDPRGRFWIDFQPAVAFDSYGASEVMKSTDADLKTRFRDEVVFVGKAYDDRYLSPLLDPVSEMEIHAQVAANILDRSFLEVKSSPWGLVVSPLVIVAFGFLVPFLISRFQGPRGGVAAFGLLVAWGFVSLSVFWISGVYLYVVWPVLAGLLAMALALVYQWWAQDPDPVPSSPVFDVFFSYNRKNSAVVLELAEILKSRKIRVWVDIWENVPGRPWQEQIEQAILGASSAAVMVGREGFGTWEKPEMRACLSRSVAGDFPLIPVLLPGAPDNPELSLFLKDLHWVDLRQGLSREGIRQLVKAIPRSQKSNETYGEVSEVSRPDSVSSDPRKNRLPAATREPSDRQEGPGEKCVILFLAANPAGVHQLRLDEESREIQQKIRATKYRDTLEFVTCWAVRAEDLQQALLEHRPHIVHFSGHGSRGAEIILRDRDGRGRRVSREALSGLFSVLADRIRLVVFNACYSRPQAEAIAEHIDCAVGMTDVIEDETAIAFAAAFYRAIGFGRSIEEAFALGKSELGLLGIPGAHLPNLIFDQKADPSAIRFV